MKKTLILCLFLLCFDNAFTQQLPLFTQYRAYHSLLNPATVSSDFIINAYRISTSASVRLQWAGNPNTPKTQVLQGEWVLQPEETFSFITGGHVINDQTGFIGATGAYGRIAGYFSGNPKNEGFSAGLNIGAVQYRLNTTQARLSDPNDPLAGIARQKTLLDVSVGIFGYRSVTDDEDNILYGGLSMLQALRPNASNENNIIHAPIQPVRHYYGQIGFYRFLSAESFLEFSSWLRYVKNTPFQADFNFRYQMQEYLWFGVGFSTSRILHGEIGFLLGQLFQSEKRDFKIGYGYDASFSAIAPFYGTSHEINLTFLIR